MPWAVCGTSCSRKCCNRADHHQQKTTTIYDTACGSANVFSVLRRFAFLRVSAPLFVCRHVDQRCVGGCLLLAKHSEVQRWIYFWLCGGQIIKQNAVRSTAVACRVCVLRFCAALVCVHLDTLLSLHVVLDLSSDMNPRINSRLRGRVRRKLHAAG